MQQRESGGKAADIRPLLAPLIRRDATEEQVVAAAEKVEEAAAKNRAIRNEVGRIANTIINAGKLENYGTSTCQEYLKKWAKEFGDPRQSPSKDETPTKDEQSEPKQ